MTCNLLYVVNAHAVDIIDSAHFPDKETEV